MSKCIVNVVLDNEYTSRLIVLIANELDFDARASRSSDGDINIVSPSFYLKNEPLPHETICVVESGDTIPRGAETIITDPFSLDDMKSTLLRVYNAAYGDTNEAVLKGNKLIFGDSSVVLTEREALLYAYLSCRADIPVSRNELFENIWNGKASTSTNVVDVYVNYIRKKTRSTFGVDMIRSCRKIGYMYTRKYTYKLT